MLMKIWQSHVIDRILPPVFQKLLSNKRLHETDRRIITALETIFVSPPPQTDDPEDEFDFILIRMLFFGVILMSILKLVIIVTIGLAEAGVLNLFLGLTVATFSYALFHMLYFEMKETGFMPIFIATVILVLGIWTAI